MNPYQTPKSEMVETLTPDFSDLIAKLSEATAGSRELDLAMAEALGEWFSYRDTLPPEDGLPRHPMDIRCAAITTSVDFILALIEKRLPGWSPSIVKVLHEPVWMGEVVSPDLDEDDISEVGADGSAATPALALCVAFLNALQDQQTDAALKPEGGETP